jgi:aryl-alcohol dehydrogenase-like predicted oxidoreductase
MEYVQLGNSGIKISPLCLGTMTFGKETDKAEAKVILDHCRDIGLNFIDCANVYQMGVTESMLGELIQDYRHEVILTSKVAMPNEDGLNQSCASRLAIKTQAELSLKRLRTEYLDLYYIHRFDPDTAIDESLAAMELLIKQGKVLHIGVSNWAAWQIAKGLGIAALRQLPKILCVQPMYNLVKRQAEVEILPLAQAEGLAVVPYNPLGGGLLTGKYLNPKQSDGRIIEAQMYSNRYPMEMYGDTVRRFVEFCTERGFNPVTTAVAWVRSHPGITAPIIGGRSLEQLKSSMAAAEFDMSPELRNEITGLTPLLSNATDRLEELG